MVIGRETLHLQKMYTSLTCVALRTVKYSDRTSILSAYSAQRGRVSLSIPAGKGREAARLRALVMPMGVFECQADIRPGRDISPIRDVRAVVLPAAGNPVASVQAMFLADILQGLLSEPQQDEALFSFLASASRHLNLIATPTSPTTSKGTLANFHIAFLLRLQRFMGVEPDWSTYRTGSVFDMSGGIFRLQLPNHPRYLPAHEARAAWEIHRMTLRNCHVFKLSRSDRNTILDRLLAYFHIHFPTLPASDSAAILRHMFDF